jgi:type IV pilus assembly protein PilM
MFDRQSLGLEISHSGLQMAVLSGNRKAPKLTAYSAKDFPEGTVQTSFKELNVTDPSSFVNTVRESYLKLISPMTRVSLSLPDSAGRVMLLDLETRFKSRQEGTDIIRWKLKKNFPLDIENIFLDYQILRESETGGILTLVSVITKQVVTQYEDLLLEAGLEPVFIDFSTFNLYRLFCQRLELSANSVFITFFACSVSITVFHQGILVFYRSKEIPAEIFEAERIFREISNSLLLYKNSHPGYIFDDVFYATTLDDSKDLSSIVAEITGVEPFSLNAVDFIAGKNGFNCAGKTLQNLSPALGAAIRNL